MFVIGIDLGGTKIEACLADAAGRILSRVRITALPDRPFAGQIEAIVALAAKAAAGRSFGAVGIGTPGTYDAQSDTLFGSPHTRSYEKPGLISGLQARLGVPLEVENDANCLALAEFFSTCRGRYRNVLAVILGTGVGGGLILGDRLYRGPRGNAGEIGHTTVDRHGRLCQCGRRGCAEAYLSGPSHRRRFQERTGLELDLPQIHELYERGDPAARELFAESLEVMAELFANMVNVLDLEAIILGGGVSNLPLWYSGLGPLMEKRFFGMPRPDFPVLPAALGDSAGVLGAAYLGLRRLGAVEF